MNKCIETCLLSQRNVRGKYVFLNILQEDNISSNALIDESQVHIDMIS